MQPVQVKMARAALDLSLETLAERAGVSVAGLQELEAGEARSPDTEQGLGLFFAAHGIELIDSDGVRAKSSEAARAVPVEDLTTGNDGGQG